MGVNFPFNGSTFNIFSLFFICPKLKISNLIQKFSSNLRKIYANFFFVLEKEARKSGIGSLAYVNCVQNLHFSYEKLKSHHNTIFIGIQDLYFNLCYYFQLFKFTFYFLFPNFLN